MSRRALLYGLTLALSLCAAQQATAQRLIVLTQPRSVLGEVGALLAQSVDLYRRNVLPSPLKLPGPHVTSSLQLSEDGMQAFLSTSQNPFSPGTPGREDRFTDTFVISLRTVPFARDFSVPMHSDPTARTWLANSGSVETADAPLRMLAYPGENENEFGGAIAELGVAMPRWFLPDAPVDAVTRGDSVVILCSSPDGPSLYVCREAATRVADFPPPALGRNGLRAEGLVGAAKGDVLVALSALKPETPDEVEQTWLVLVDPVEARVKATLSLRGAPFAGGIVIHGTAAGNFWIATRAIRADFATLYGVQIEGDTLIKTVERSLGDAQQHVQLVAAPEGGGVAVGWGTQVGVWDREGQSVWNQTFDFPLGALAWTGEGLFSGWGRFVAAHDPQTGAMDEPVALDSGWVVNIAVVPARLVPPDDEDGDGLSALQEARRGTSVTNADSDDDGIPDGVDPLPTTPSPRLRVPAAFYFHGAAAGRELKALVIDPGSEADAPWGIRFDQRSMPWLRIFPTAGTGKQVVYLGIDAEAYPKGRHVRGDLTVTMTSRRLGLPAPESPATIRVHVLPDPYPLREILWVWGDIKAHLRRGAGAYDLGAVAARLASAPFYFSHREIHGPLSESLDQFKVVVLDFPAVVQGAVTRQELLDYVAAGGSALLLGRALAEEGERSLQQWLAPAGITLLPAGETGGIFTPRPGWPFDVERDALSVNGSLLLRADNAAAAIPVANGAEDLVFAATDYAQGRLAVAGHASLLSGQPEFAVRLFHWLAESGTKFEDLDDDGLPDDREDARIAGLFDPTRTDRTNPDTDGDGLPDGMEDRNRNGVVDIGETDPRNADTDGDGIPDGADPTPLPPISASFTTSPNTPPS